MSARHHHAAHGFSLVEVLIATALTLLVLAFVFDAVRPAYGDAGTATETADVQQRLRVAADTLVRGVSAAGSGPTYGRYPGPLNGAIAAVFPYRVGRRAPDPPGTVKPNVITALAIPAGAAVTTLAQPLPARSATVQINLDPGCRTGDASCGFRTSTMAMVFNDTGGFDLYTVTAVTGSLLTLQHAQADSAVVYPPNSRIAEVTSRTYSLKTDRVNEVYQLVEYDGGAGGDVPVVDHVVDLGFDYVADPEPPRLRKPLTAPAGPWTTYGPVPPQLLERPTALPAGENCTFLRDAAGEPAPRLPSLGAGRAPVHLAAAQLSDGPWCPDDTSPNRYDADLLRVRAVGVIIRVESASAALRGPAGLLFSRAGSAREGRWLVADQVARFQVAPPNLNVSP